jgi:hypothetical protein
MPRRYRLNARARRQDDNRRRIVEAAYQLHMTIGASRASINPVSWQAIADPRQRLLVALTELYPSYRRNRVVLADISNFEGVSGVESLFAMLAQQRDWQRGILAEGWQVVEERRESLMAALGHAIDFWTWRSLSEGQGLDDEKASILMTEMVQSVAG